MLGVALLASLAALGAALPQGRLYVMLWKELHLVKLIVICLTSNGLMIDSITFRLISLRLASNDNKMMNKIWVPFTSIYMDTSHLKSGC